mmetsp:Transcript_219/g.438  ORF Transcript_219/g.438 Transcript_219/m.438 type:complete len:261 (-) Transcript_219:959-1741(-)
MVVDQPSEQRQWRIGYCGLLEEPDLHAGDPDAGADPGPGASWCGPSRSSTSADPDNGLCALFQRKTGANFSDDRKDHMDNADHMDDHENHDIHGDDHWDDHEDDHWDVRNNLHNDTGPLCLQGAIQEAADDELPQIQRRRLLHDQGQGRVREEQGWAHGPHVGGQEDSRPALRLVRWQDLQPCRSQRLRALRLGREGILLQRLLGAEKLRSRGLPGDEGSAHPDAVLLLPDAAAWLRARLAACTAREGRRNLQLRGVRRI